MLGQLQEIYLAAPRGFCAGVKRAIALAEKALHDFGAPVYVRHEIVHNKHVVESLRQRGVIFIEELDEIQDATRPIIVSAHGAPRRVYDEAAKRGLKLVDATCPLVEKVHRQICRLEEQGAEILIVGKKEHAEIIGTAGQVKAPEKVQIINSINDAANLKIEAGKNYGVVTQTTLSTDEAAFIIAEIRRQLPNLITQDKNDICYATTHRQAAVRELSKICDGVIIIGSANSSNSKHLKETALQNGVKKAWLIDDAGEMPWKELEGIKKLGISAGASAPEHLVTELCEALCQRYKNLKIQDVIVAEEKTTFKF